MQKFIWITQKKKKKGRSIDEHTRTPSHPTVHISLRNGSSAGWETLMVGLDRGKQLKCLEIQERRGSMLWEDEIWRKRPYAGRRRVGENRFNDLRRGFEEEPCRFLSNAGISEPSKQKKRSGCGEWGGTPARRRNVEVAVMLRLQ